MDESDDDFNELCSKLLRRVRKKGAKEGLGETRTQKEASNVQTKSKLKRTKLSTKTKASHDSTEKKAELGKRGLAPGNEGKCEDTSHESRVAPTAKREEDVLATAQKESVPQPSHPKNWTGIPDDSSQTASHSLSTLLPSVSKPRAAEVVLQKMQQFKRADPERLKHAPEGCTVESTLKENVPKSIQEEDTLNNGNMPGLSQTESDAALALALQQEFGQETPQNSESLEQEGLFFCQICQKDLSAMNATRREQHVNRCLDEAEKSLEPASTAPKIPECPICGKPFTTLKSRNSHLKQCAVKMEVSPQQLVQAVRMQTFQPNECFPSASSKPTVESKRKGSTNEKKPPKRRKISRTEAVSEDLLVAMAMSHSLMEESNVVTNDNLGNVLPNSIRPGAEKKGRKRKLVSPPPLLVQDSKTYLQQIQDRVAILLTEELELSSTPTLPLSKILKEEMGKAHWCLLQSEEQEGILWKGSSLTGAWPLDSFYAKGLDPPILPWKPPKNSEKGLLPLMAFSQSKPDVQELPAFSDSTSEGFNLKTPEELNSRRQSLSCSQKDHQTLQVLIDLAGEGLTLTQWSNSAETHSRSPSGKDLGSYDLPLTGFVLSSKEKKYQRSSSSALSLSLLSADFGTMVNNPHLSDVQFQMDSGDVLYAHMFVLYARCPQLIQIIHNEGFFVVEDGNLRTQRVLLNEVSTEAAHMFLQYLYTADTNIPAHLLTDLQSLALRFGVKELVDLCESSLEATDTNSEDDMFLVRKEEEDCESRAENFKELLRSMWVDEDKKSEIFLELEDQEEDDIKKVNEEEMEEIYEFAATQQKMLQGKCQTNEYSVASHPGEEIPVFACLPESVTFKKQMDNTCKIDSSEQVKGQEPSVSSNLNIKHFTPRPSQEKIPDDEGGIESPKKDCSPKPTKTDTHSSTSDLLVESRGDNLREKFTSLDSSRGFDLDKSCDELFSMTEREYCEPSQIHCSPKKLKGTFPVKEVSGSPILCQTPPLQPDFLPSHSHCQSPSNSQFFSQCRHDSSPFSPQLKRKFSKIVSPILTEKRKENNDILTLYEDSDCKDSSECGYIASHKNTALPISPVKPPSIDLTQPKSYQRLSQSNIRSQNSPSQVNKDDDVILLLDSDEEMELEQTKMKPVSDSPCRERKTPRKTPFTYFVGRGKEMKNSPKISQPFLIIDIDSDPPRYSQGSIVREVGIHTDVLTEVQSHSKEKSCLDDELDFRPLTRHEESSTTDTSWLVPATPLSNRSHDCSSHMRVTGIISRPCVSNLQDKVLQCKTKVLIEDKDVNEITNKDSITGPETSSHLVPITSETKSLSETSVDERYSYRSPTIQYSKVNKNLSTVDPIQLSPEHTDLIKQSLESPSSQSRLSSADDKPVMIQNVYSEVVEVVDSEEEQDLDPCPLSSSLLLNSDPPIPVDDDCWNIEPLSPIPIDNLNLERIGQLSTSSPNNKVCETLNNRERNSPGALSRMGSTPVCESPMDKRRSLHYNEKRSSCAGSPRNSNLSYLNSALWDDWDGEQKSTEILPLAKRLSNEESIQELEMLKTPKAADQKTNRPPKVPITPMPSYSIMETPELKKELNRFGVRPLPKRQMVLKLKEIFQYTHQILPSDSEDEIQALQASSKLMGESCCLTQTTSQVKTSGAVSELPPASSSCALPSVEGSQSEGSENLSSISHQRLKNLSKIQNRRKRPRKAILTLTQPPPEDVHPGPTSDNHLSMSQKSIASSTDESENSFGSQSSIASEFETVFESEGEEEEGITASQAAVQDADKEEAVRRYIRSHPALYQKILLYQPFELADLQAELKQNGIKFAMGKLLDFLDAHCITFTTAGARKEKLKKKKLQPGAKKRGKHF